MLSINPPHCVNIYCFTKLALTSITIHQPFICHTCPMFCVYYRCFYLSLRIIHWFLLFFSFAQTCKIANGYGKPSVYVQGPLRGVFFHMAKAKLLMSPSHHPWPPMETPRSSRSFKYKGRVPTPIGNSQFILKINHPYGSMTIQPASKGVEVFMLKPLH